MIFSVFSLAASWLAYSFCGSFQRHRNVIGSSLVWLLLSFIYLLFFKGVIKKILEAVRLISHKLLSGKSYLCQLEP